MDSLKDFYNFYRPLQRKYDLRMFYKTNGKETKITIRQRVDIWHKASGRHILQSYDRDLMDEKKIGNTCVGLTGYEMKLFLKKMKKLGLYSKTAGIEGKYDRKE